MKSKFLLPSRFKSIGWLIFIPSIILGFLTIVYQWEPAFLDMRVFAIFIDEFMGEKRLMGMLDNNILNEILGILAMVSGLMVAFSRERDEDELISKVRLESLVWATYWNYGVLILAMILVYDLAFFWVMVFNMFTILLFFIIRFNWILWNMRKSLGHEE